MAECIKCGLKVSWIDYPLDTCSSCRSAGGANESQPSEKQDVKKISAATAFTSLTWVIVALTFIFSLIATLVTAANGDAFSAMIIFISGSFSAVLLGLLAEISANIAKLVNNSR